MKQPFHPVIGIIGGGQLGKMLIESSASWNLNYNILDPDKDAPCKSYAKTFINAALTDDKAIRELAGISDVLTYEIEHINVDTLLDLEKSGKTIIPSPAILKVIQDKGLQKQFYIDNNLPTVPYQFVSRSEMWPEALQKLNGDKIVAKLCKGGYDGKGVVICERSEILKGNLPFDAPCILEEFIPQSREIAILVASNGYETVTWPSVEMDFDPQLNLVDYIFSPGNLDRNTEELAANIAISAIKALNGKGVFAVEMFLTNKGEILINEIAPRPHNSGHHTIEAAITSQYEQLNRILLNLPLGNTEFLRPAVMVNIIGPKEVTGNYKISGLNKAMNVPGFYLHLYKKDQSRPGRKMGHFTVMADTLDIAIKNAMQIKDWIKIEQV
jgi:5-(carboxyamino)imidazole ribonucleotide synthase